MKSLAEVVRAKNLVFKKNGHPKDVLADESKDLVVSPLAENHVLVKILAAPINPADLNTIIGNYGVKSPLPGIPGSEGCGEVVMTNSTDFKIGDRVIFLQRIATWTSHAIVSAASLFKLPKRIDPVQAAMLKINPATAWCLLHRFVNLAEGDWIVQNAGNSGVGRCVIQLARDLKVRTISFVRRHELIAELTALGANHVFVDDETGHVNAAKILAKVNVFAGFNAVGGESALRLMKHLSEGASHITYGAMAMKPMIVPNGMLIFRNIHIRGLWVSRWLEESSREDLWTIYDELATRVMDGRLKQAVDSTFPLEAFQAALQRLEAPDRIGKILFVPM